MSYEKQEQTNWAGDIIVVSHAIYCAAQGAGDYWRTNCARQLFSLGFSDNQCEEGRASALFPYFKISE